MAVTVASSTCADCWQNPSHTLLPCTHSTCLEHYKEYSEDEKMICGVCREEISAIDEINSGPATDPAHRTHDEWSVEDIRQRFTSLGEMDRPRDVEGKPKDLRSSSPVYPKTSYTTTARHPMIESHDPSGYVPLPSHFDFDPSIRPESSVSNMTFETQPPTQPPTQMPPPPFTPPQNADGNGPAGLDFTSSGYRFGPQQLSQRLAALDPFWDAPQASSRGGNHFSNNRGSNSFGYGHTPNRNPAPPMPGYPWMQGSPQDSFAANRSPAHFSRAAYLADLIRSGATDDPDDIDYGNPGPSNRLPPEPPNPQPTAPKPIGKIAAGYSNALVSYNDAEANTKGNPVVYLGVNDTPRPQWLAHAQDGYKPTVEEVFDSMPMIEGSRYAKPTTAGVLKISNIPYASSRSEIVAFLGRNAQIISQPEGAPYHAVHIMMDRHTGKTNDVFVEVKTPKEAVFIVSQFNKRRSMKIGDRDVEMAVSSQAEFMAELFPRAKNVEWYGPVPKVSEEREHYYPGAPSSGFRGFLQNEELTFMAKHAENPGRSPFASRVPYRNYEALVTLLHKYPWHAVDHVLLHERAALYDVTLKCLRSLMAALNDTKKNAMADRSLPTKATLQELVVAALTCPGFSEGHKALIAVNMREAGFQQFLSTRGLNFRFGGTHEYAQCWPFHGLIKHPGVHDDVVEYIASLFRKATTNVENMTLAQLHSLRATRTNPAGKFGNFKADYRAINTLADLGAAELRAIEEVLSRVLPRAAPRGGSSSYGSPGARHFS